MKRFASTLMLLASATISFGQTSSSNSEDTAVRNLIVKHQVLLTNYAEFKGRKKVISGASAFLINYRNNTYAITAKHLLGEGMGIKPVVKPNEIDKALIVWQMFPRVPVQPKMDTVNIIPSHLDYSSLEMDILMLAVEKRPHNIQVLTPEFQLPEIGEKLYIIGCPYSEEDCKQNIYEVSYVGYDAKESMLNFTIKSKFELPGFSGAPIVNSKGNVVAVFTSEWESTSGKKYLGGIWINEIKSVL